MSLFSQYFKEREDVDCLENEGGFVLFKLEHPHVYISDIFVRKDLRRSQKAKELADQVCSVAKHRGYTTLIGSVDLTANNYEASFKVLKAYGMEEFKRVNNMIYFKKELF